jgi:hypothetical protein
MKKLVILMCFSLYSLSALARMNPVTTHFYCTTFEGDSGIALIDWANFSVFEARYAHGTDLIATDILVNLTEQETQAMRAVNPYVTNSINISSGAILGDSRFSPEVTRSTDGSLTLSVDDSLRATGTMTVDFSKLTEFPARIRELGVKNFTLKLDCQKDVTF